MKRWGRVGGLAVGLALCGLCSGAAAEPAGNGAGVAHLFSEKWIDGTRSDEPKVQVQALDRDTFVIRQSVLTNFEAPFLYLLFGKDKVLLLDSGAGGLQIRPEIDAIISNWLAAHGRTSIPLVVAHTHAHGDHIAGDEEFKARPDTTVVGLRPEEVAAFFGIARWPDTIGHYDLGARALQIIPTPGHQSAHIMVYDPRLRLLLSGDALYPGRLYVPVNFLADKRASVARLRKFVDAHPVDAVLGAHIEMTAQPGRDYPQAAAQHPNERHLELPATSVAELNEGLQAALDVPGKAQVHDDFIIFPVPPRKN